MSTRTTRGFALALLIGIFALVSVAWALHRPGAAPVPVLGTSRAELHPLERRAKRLGGLDVTFVVASDTHFGFGASERDLLGRVRDPSLEPRGTELVNARAIAAMNELPGRPWPTALGGSIGTPRGVLVSGDLTENGEPWQWRGFVAYYGLNGRDGLLKYPVYEGHGNHDKHHSWFVLDRIRERHGGTRYALDWDDLHVVNLGEAPDDEGLAWLRGDLETVGKERPIVIYFHFPLRGPYSDNWFGDGDYRNRLRGIVSGYNVIAFFHGHYHATGRYRWSGHDIYNVGASKHRFQSFAVVHVTDRALRVAEYNYDKKLWEWWHQKSINGAPAASLSGATLPNDGVLLEDE